MTRHRPLWQAAKERADGEKPPGRQDVQVQYGLSSDLARGDARGVVDEDDTLAAGGALAPASAADVGVTAGAADGWGGVVSLAVASLVAVAVGGGGAGEASRTGGGRGRRTAAPTATGDGLTLTGTALGDVGASGGEASASADKPASATPADAAPAALSASACARGEALSVEADGAPVAAPELGGQAAGAGLVAPAGCVGAISGAKRCASRSR